VKNILHLFASHAAPASSDAVGTAASTDPTLIIEAQFSLDSILPLFNFYDNGRAQDLLAILLAKAAELATTAGGALTPDLSAAVTQAQAITPAAPVLVVGTPATIAPVIPITPAAPVVAAPVVETPASPATPALVPIAVDPTSGSFQPASPTAPATHLLDPTTNIATPLAAPVAIMAPTTPAAPVLVVDTPAGATPIVPTVIIAGS